MVCEVVDLGNGQRAIVCGPRKPSRKCSGCGRTADLLCDWKVPGKKSGTCDKPVCRACAFSPAPGKDICPEHAPACREWLAAR